MLPQSKTNEVTHGNQYYLNQPQVKKLHLQHVEPFGVFQSQTENSFYSSGSDWIVKAGYDIIGYCFPVIKIIVFLLEVDRFIGFAD